MTPIAPIIAAVVFALVVAGPVAAESSPPEQSIQREIASLLGRYNTSKHAHGKGRETLTLAIGIYNLRAGQLLCEYSRGDEKQFGSCLTQILRTRDLMGLCKYASSTRSEQCIDETLSFDEMRDKLEVAAYQPPR